ncbi:retrovirus-related pol polyprotein from transposon TNT 1-94 [Tanacetum coccineum]|uniref:Retrovirus-related pol polyprotein from transposon TNT 1-94 n=1 Tax=Tanacetum coccineum TaxID=301880 RepID=A0ABQ4WVR7_9ASTR
MASKQFSSGLGLHYMTPAISSTGLGSNPVSQQPCLPPIRDDWDRLFQPIFDEYFNPPTITISPVQEAAAPRDEVLADSPVSTSIDQDALSTSIPSSQEHKHSLIISQGSSSNVRQLHTPLEHLGRWTKDHPIANVIGDPSRSVSIRKQLETDAMWCYFDAFLTLVEPKNFKHAMTKPSWIDAMQEKIHEIKRLEVWELVSCPDKVFLIKLKWIYKVKTDESGGVLKKKARLVAQGFKQEEGINFKESFAPVAKISSRPDLNYVVCLCAWYQAKPIEKHLQAVKRFFRYLDGTIHMSLWYSKDTDCPQVMQMPDLGVKTRQSIFATFLKEASGEMESWAILFWTDNNNWLTSLLSCWREFNFLIDKLGMKSMSPETLKHLAEETDE